MPWARLASQAAALSRRPVWDQNCRSERAATSDSTNEARPGSRYTVYRGIRSAGYLRKSPASAPARALRIKSPLRSNTDVGNMENRMVAGWPGIVTSASLRSKLAKLCNLYVIRTCEASRLPVGALLMPLTNDAQMY